MWAELALEMRHASVGLLIPMPPMRAGRLSRSRSLSLISRRSSAQKFLPNHFLQWLEQVEDFGHCAGEEGPLALQALRERREGSVRLRGGDLSELLRYEIAR